MYRLVIFSDQKLNFTSWHSWLERDFEITYVTQVESLGAIIESWGPQVLIYSQQVLHPEHVARVLSAHRVSQSIGWVAIGQAYNMRDELTCFESGVDHYLLFSTPAESIRARLLNLAQKSKRREKSIANSNLVMLPKRKDELSLDEFEMILAHGVIKMRGEIRHVTPTQYRLIEALVSHTGTPLTREWLRENVFKNNALALRSIDAQVAKVKKALPELRDHIINLYGAGYILKPPRHKISA